MEAGGGPERDDYGLPRVDVEVPDDARELDPDVQAYRRELRARRRQQRANRLRRPLRRDGMALPLLAASLMLALITSTLLVLFAADETGVPQLPRTGTRNPPVSAQTQARKAGQPLPPAQILINGKREPLQAMTKHAPSLLALVPADCACAPALRKLATQADRAQVALYLIGTPGATPQVTQLAAQAGQSNSVVGEDVDDVLAPAYRESGQLTGILVKAGGTVAFVAHGLTQARALGPLETELRQVRPAAAGQ